MIYVLFNPYILVIRLVVSIFTLHSREKLLTRGVKQSDSCSDYDQLHIAVSVLVAFTIYDWIYLFLITFHIKLHELLFDERIQVRMSMNYEARSLAANDKCSSYEKGG